MKYTKFVKWEDGGVTHTTYNFSIERIIDIMRNDLNYDIVVSTWLEDENGKELAYFDKHNEITKEGENMKKGTKEEVLNEIKRKTQLLKFDIREVLELLEKEGYIEFKKEPNEYKVFVKMVTIGEEDKKLYYVTDFHLTENIDEAKLFDLNEEKDGYAYEIVKESV